MDLLSSPASLRLSSARNVAELWEDHKKFTAEELGLLFGGSEEVSGDSSCVYFLPISTEDFWSQNTLTNCPVRHRL
ncbi:hypothetical protein M5K25_017290 [Dendrobium thyrsiflorum]|uniref:Uncharacterized protein n=1 Tax=Dendrobium thyrsiflorum TaxID=117978 RepID=A0ABD0UMC8_DENTH